MSPLISISPETSDAFCGNGCAFADPRVALLATLLPESLALYGFGTTPAGEIWFKVPGLLSDNAAIYVLGVGPVFESSAKAEGHFESSSHQRPIRGNRWFESKKRITCIVSHVKRCFQKEIGVSWLHPKYLASPNLTGICHCVIVLWVMFVTFMHIQGDFNGIICSQSAPNRASHQKDPSPLRSNHIPPRCKNRKIEGE